MKQKGKHKGLLCFLVVSVFVGGIAVFALHRYRVESWKEQARHTFREALQDELKKRDIHVFFYSSGYSRLYNDLKDTVTMQRSESEKKDFIIPPERLSNYMGESSISRLMHSYILEKYPLQADVVADNWRKRLAEKGFLGKTTVRIAVLDWDEHEASTFSGDSSYVAKSDSLVSYYIGKRCEVASTGYIHCSWLSAFTVSDMVLLCFFVLFCVLLYLCRSYICVLYYRMLRGSSPAQPASLVSIEVGEQNPVMAVAESGPHVYRLEDGLLFDADSRILRKGDKTVKLTASLAKLLKHFLEAQEYRLSMSEIKQILWPEDMEVADSRVHTMVGRLRKSLSEISEWQIVNGILCYQLKRCSNE